MHRAGVIYVSTRIVSDGGPPDFDRLICGRFRRSIEKSFRIGFESFATVQRTKEESPAVVVERSRSLQRIDDHSADRVFDGVIGRTLHRTTIAPRNIFIPQVNLKRPDLFGVISTRTGVFRGSGRFIL